MDATLVGVVGSLAGVALGASTQHFQASARRKWELEDSEREKRREAYAQYISAVDEYRTAVVQYLGLLDLSASEEAKRSKRQEIKDIDQRLRLMDGPLSMIAGERVEIVRTAVSAVLGLFYTLESSDGKGGLDVEWVRFLASQHSQLIVEMRDDLARKPQRRSRITRLFWKRPAPSREHLNVPLPVRSSTWQNEAPVSTLRIGRASLGLLTLTGTPATLSGLRASASPTLDQPSAAYITSKAPGYYFADQG